MFVSGLIVMGLSFTSCEKSVPMNNDTAGMSFTLNSSVWDNPQYEDFLKRQEPQGKTFPICKGSWDFGRNFGNTWFQDEFNNLDAGQYDRMYGDSIGYISFGEGGLGELVIVNYDTIFNKIPFTYEVLQKTKQTTYMDIQFESQVIRTYVVKELGSNPPLHSFNYTYYADLMVGVDEYVIYQWEGNTSDYNGVFKWTGTNIMYVNSWENEPCR